MVFLQEDEEFQDVCSALFMVISECLGSIILSPFPFLSPVSGFSFSGVPSRGEAAVPRCSTSPPPSSMGRFHPQLPNISTSVCFLIWRVITRGSDQKMRWSGWAGRLPSLQPQHEEERPDLCPRCVCVHPPVALKVCFGLGCDRVKSKIHPILFCFLSFHS